VTVTTYYSADFLVKCDRTEGQNRNSPLNFANLQVTQNASNPCLINVVATHPVGCPYVEVQGFVQYLTNHPFIIAAILLAFGVASTFFGGKLFDWVVASLAAIVTFLIVSMLASALGGFRLLESSSAFTFGRFIATLFSFLVAGAAAFAAGWFVKKTSRIAMGVLGGIGGFFIAFLVYGLVFAKLVTSSTWLLWVFMFAGVAGGAFLSFKFKSAITVQLTATVGAYALIRALALVAGGYPNEFEMMS
jgi:MFS family permease